MKQSGRRSGPSSRDAKRIKCPIAWDAVTLPVLSITRRGEVRDLDLTGVPTANCWKESEPMRLSAANRADHLPRQAPAVEIGQNRALDRIIFGSTATDSTAKGSDRPC